MKPENKANAENVQETNSHALKLALLRYEQLFNLYAEEPYIIKVKMQKSSRYQEYEQVFRIRKWLPNVGAYAYYLYSTERECFGENFILRKVSWDRKEDENRVRQQNEFQRDELLFSWPSIIAESIFLATAEYGNILDLLSQMDEVVRNGISLKAKPTRHNFDYNNIECSRRYDWGEVKSIWNSNMENMELEELIIKFENECKAVKNNGNQVYQMDFDYLFNPDEMKNSIYGTKE